MAETLLELDQVNTSYGDSHVLHDVSLSIDERETVVLLGRNGAGKTTTLRSIMGIQPPFGGDIRFRGENISQEPTLNIARRGIKYVPEERRVFDKLTVEEHLLMAIDSNYRSKEEEFQQIYEIFPALEKISNQMAENMSGGEQQMLAIARALIGPTELLLLDEPSEGLAPKIVETIFKTIKKMKEDTPILLVEQNYPMARAVADKYYLLDQGRIVSCGDMEQLEESEELRNKYLGIS